MSATTPVGTSNRTIPAVKNAFAVKARVLDSPASSKKIVLIPQISEAASVLPSRSTRYVRCTDAGVAGGAGRFEVNTEGPPDAVVGADGFRGRNSSPDAGIPRLCSRPLWPSRPLGWRRSCGPTTTGERW